MYWQFLSAWARTFAIAYMRNQPTTPPDFSKGYRWAWQTASPGYWNYPMSQDGHIFRTEDFVRLLPTLKFVAAPTRWRRDNPRRPSLALIWSANNTPVLSISPPTRSSHSSIIAVGTFLSEHLNHLFLEGKAIDVGAFAGRIYDSCHIEEDLPLVSDSRPRQRPEADRIEKDGKPHRVIDLRRIPVFVLNCPDDEENRNRISEQMSGLGMQFEFVAGIRVDPGWVGVALGHAKILRLSRAVPPFLVLEDDVVFKDNFDPVLEIPAEADAYYLGVSRFGNPIPGEVGFGRPNVVQWQHYSPGHLRVFNMLARHAVLYLDESFQQRVIDSQLEALTNRKLAHPGDMGLAALQASHVVLTPRYNVSRQRTRDATDFDLPEAMPDTEQFEPSEEHPPYDHPTRCVVSHKYRFIYFAVAKNASSTLKSVLCRPEYGGKDIVFHKVDKALLESYFTFTFLRDPVKRVASAYQEICYRHDTNEPGTKFRPFMELPDGIDKFAAFLKQIEDGHWDQHLRYQVVFLQALEMNFYGRVENLNADLSRLFKLLGMGPCPRLPASRSKEERAKKTGYLSHQIQTGDLPQDLKERIYEIYDVDVAMLKRRCPEPTLRRPIDVTEVPMGCIQYTVQLRGGHQHEITTEIGLNFPVGTGKSRGSINERRTARA